MTWKSAIAKAWRARCRHHMAGALIVGSVCGIISIFLHGILPGLMTWAWLAVVMFTIYLLEDAHLQRKRARKDAPRVSD